MGAWEDKNYWNGAIGSTDWGSASNWSAGVVPLADDNIVFSANPADHCYLDQDRSIRSIYNTQSTDKLAIVGNKLTIKGSLNFTNGAQIIAYVPGSTVEFAGASAQSIPSGAFAANQVYNLTINNSNNVTLNGGLNLLNTLTATSGKLDAVTNTPTLVYFGSSAQTLATNQFVNDQIYNLAIYNSAGVTLTNTALTTVTHDFSINSGAKFTIPSGKMLTVNGTMTNSTGTGGLLLESTASGVGSLIHYTSEVTGTVQRYLEGTDNDHYFSSPVSSSLTFDDVFSYIDGSSVGWNSMFIWIREFNEPTNAWVNRHHSYLALFGKGYASYIPAQGTEVPGIGTAPAPPNPPLSLFTGTLGVGDVPFSLSYTGPDNGWNFVGNPYPSAIDWDLIEKTGAVDGTVYVWSNGGYIEWNGSLGGLTDGLIPVGMSFFVHTTASDASLTFQNTDRVHSNGSFWKSENTLPELLTIKVSNSINDKTDKVFINFNSEATFGFDSQFDAYQLPSVEDAPELYTAGDPALSINVLKSVSESPVIPLGFKAGVNGNFTFTAEGIESFANEVPIYLEDLTSGVKTNLRTNPVYSFTSETGTFDNRFRLWFAPVGIEEPGNYVLESWASGNIIHVAVPEGCKGTVHIYNVFGQLVTSVPAAQPGIIDIPLNNPPGAYIVTLSTPVCKFSSKVITR